MNTLAIRHVSWLVFGSFVCLFVQQRILAQELSVPALTEDDRQALDVITERSVTGTVAFLASDEMGGRGTPSPEFRIATAYVAARFQAAGLIGGGDQGSFYQVAEIETVQLPNSGIVLSGDHAIKHYGLLNAGDTELTYQGELKIANLEDSEPLSGAVIIASPDRYRGRRGMSTLARDASALQQRGATAILLPVAADDELVNAAEQGQQPRMAGRSNVSLPVLLVDQGASLTGKIDLVCPAIIKTKTEIRNVIGVLPGSDEKLAQEAVVFSAHLDHLGTHNGEPDPIYNGADDDASGVTAVVSLADAFGALKHRPRRSAVFMTFWGEERGLLGSRYYAEHPLWPLNEIVANVNIEMIGRPEAGARNKVWETGWERSNLGPLMAAGARRVDTLVFEHPKYSGDMLYRASDNWSLANLGVIAHSFSAGSLHSDYHQPTDDWQKLELDHMTAVIRGLFAGALPIVNGDLTPTKTK